MRYGCSYFPPPPSPERDIHFFLNDTLRTAHSSKTVSNQDSAQTLMVSYFFPYVFYNWHNRGGGRTSRCTLAHYTDSKEINLEFWVFFYIQKVYNEQKEGRLPSEVLIYRSILPFLVNFSIKSPSHSIARISELHNWVFYV